MQHRLGINLKILLKSALNYFVKIVAKKLYFEFILFIKRYKFYFSTKLV